MKGPIQSVEATCLIHATEDPQRVKRALSVLLNTDAEPDVERLVGHFGNEILKATLHLTGDEAGKAFSSLASRLPPTLREELAAGIGAYLDEHSALFLRFDKQRLISGSLVLGAGDSVRVKVKPRVFLMKGGGAKFYAGFLGGR